MSPRIETWARLLLLASLGASAACGGSAPVTASAPPPTLRALYGLPHLQSIVPEKTALVLVDYQEEFFIGKLPVERGVEAVAHATELLEWARKNGVFVVHVRNVVTGKGPIFQASSPTVEIVPKLSPLPDEDLVTKASAGGFTKTDLAARLRSRGIDTLVVAGIMTHLAVDTTVRDGAILGFRVAVAGDACATRPLPGAIETGSIDASTVHRVALASLADRFADVMTTQTLVALPIHREASPKQN